MMTSSDAWRRPGKESRLGFGTPARGWRGCVMSGTLHVISLVKNTSRRAAYAGVCHVRSGVSLVSTRPARNRMTTVTPP